MNMSIITIASVAAALRAAKTEQRAATARVDQAVAWLLENASEAEIRDEGLTPVSPGADKRVPDPGACVALIDGARELVLALAAATTARAVRAELVALAQLLAVPIILRRGARATIRV